MVRVAGPEGLIALDVPRPELDLRLIRDYGIDGGGDSRARARSLLGYSLPFLHFLDVDAGLIAEALQLGRLAHGRVDGLDRSG